MSRLEFNNLPLLEVVIRLAPTSPITLDLEHLLKVADAIREEFPVRSFLDAPLSSVATGLHIDIGQLIGLRCEQPESGCCLYLQTNLVATAWQNRSLESDKSYVRYERLKQLLLWAVEVLNDGLPGPLTFGATNLAYTNFIATPEPPGAEDVSKYFGENLSIGLMAGADPFHELNAAWHEGGNDLRVHLRGVRGSGAPHPNGLELTSIAGRIFEQNARPDTIIDSLHQKLSTLFPDLLTETALDEWGFSVNDTSAV